MLSGFKQPILRGNVIDMAVGVVIGAAFATVVGAFTKDLLILLIAALVGRRMRPLGDISSLVERLTDLRGSGE